MEKSMIKPVNELRKFAKANGFKIEFKTSKKFPESFDIWIYAINDTNEWHANEFLGVFIGKVNNYDITLKKVHERIEYLIKDCLNN